MKTSGCSVKCTDVWGFLTQVAKHLGTEHHEVLMTPDEGIDSLKSVIFHLESYDITTIRASVGKFWITLGNPRQIP